MRLRVFLLTVLAGAELLAQPPSAFDRDFTGETMRVDYFHTGGPSTHAIALDRIVNDGPWPGSRRQLVDETNLGKYLFQVIDRDSNRLLYSRGYASIFGEWATTDEIRRVHRTFHESLRFPWPRRPVQVVVKERDRDNSFREIWSSVVDPASRFVNRGRAEPRGRAWTVMEAGATEEKVDLVVIGEGYTEAELPKFQKDIARLVEGLFTYEPFKSRRGDFNIRAIDLPAPSSGVNRPQAGESRRTTLSAEYNIFDVERYVLTYDNRTLRDVASQVPYEFVEILVNEAHYGGGGIFNDHATAAVDSAFSEYVFVHEFGHHFAALADEYYTSDVAYETGASQHPEPWEPNVTALLDPGHLKWRDLVEPDTPLPTPWDKATFEAKNREFQARRRELRARRAPESDMDQLLREQEEWETKFLGSQKYSGKIGAFEGASYEPRGLYRPATDCIMFTRDKVGFCRVCRRAIDRIIDLYAR